MIIHFQTLQDGVIALASLVGVALVFTLAIIAVSWIDQRSKARRTRMGRPTAAPAQPTDAHEPVLGKAA
jgi:hypothetical protein